ncbi:hypothetical protein TNCV_1533741 [Trichonephila clavipes]|nr:hypothetical protein TNCV_1533741 [Trichonephila clavipes]
MARRNSLDYFPRGRMVGKPEEGRSLTSSLLLKVSFRALGKPFEPKVELLERLAVAALGKKLQRMTDISSYRGEAQHQSSNAISQQLCTATWRCVAVLLWPDVLTNVAYLLSILNATFL